MSFDLAKGEMLALVGESGCGKSTLSLSLMLLERPTSGTISFEGEDVTQFKGKPLKSLRRHIQMVFQDPYESLNPLMTIGEIVAEPLLVHDLAKEPGERARRVKFAMESAGLRPPEIFLNRLPHELSGGQRQRVVIASALVLEPTVLLAEKSVLSFLDVIILHISAYPSIFFARKRAFPSFSSLMTLQLQPTFATGLLSCIWDALWKSGQPLMF